MSFLQYFSAVFCSAGVPRKSRPGPMQAQTEPQTRPWLSTARGTWARTMGDGASPGISIDLKPRFLNMGKSLVLLLVNGEVKRKVLMPSLIRNFSDRLGELLGESKGIRERECGQIMRNGRLNRSHP